MKVKTAKRAKERGVVYAPQPRRQLRAPSDLPFPHARHLTRKERAALAAFKDFLLAKFPNEIARIVLFGSKARGDGAPDSDLDLHIVVSGADPSFLADGARRSEISEGAFEVGSRFDVYISTIVHSDNETQKWTPLLDHIHKEGVELWRRPGFDVAPWPQGGQVAMTLSKHKHIEARMAVARDKLRAAKTMLEAQLYNDTISRAYYAMFYASKALLLALGEDPHKHEGVVSMYGERIAKVRLGDPKYGELLRKAKELREDADYEDFFHATKEQAEDAVQKAKDFVDQAEIVLQKIQTRGE